jgi:hypothetical protein
MRGSARHDGASGRHPPLCACHLHDKGEGSKPAGHWSGYAICMHAQRAAWATVLAGRCRASVRGAALCAARQLLCMVALSLHSPLPPPRCAARPGSAAKLGEDTCGLRNACAWLVEAVTSRSDRCVARSAYWAGIRHRSKYLYLSGTHRLHSTVRASFLDVAIRCSLQRVPCCLERAAGCEEALSVHGSLKVGGRTGYWEGNAWFGQTASQRCAQLQRYVQAQTYKWFVLIA